MKHQDIIQQSISLAEKLQLQIEQHLSHTEKRFHHKMQKLLDNPANKVMLIELLDRCFRAKHPQDRFDLIEFIFKKYGIADFFTPMEKVLLFAFFQGGKYFPKLSIPFFISYLKSDCSHLILDANPHKLQEHIAKRTDEGIIINLNLIGEEVLGEGEARHRIQKYKAALQSFDIQYISVKITTIFSQINILDFEFSKSEIVQRLKELYSIAQSESLRQKTPKFINLDMEEYRDLELTVASFMEAISEFKDLEAGIVLQAYIPDSLDYLKTLHAFSKDRVLQGGKPIKIRFVKGANMEAEETLASQKGWELPTFEEKIDTDCNYKKMLDFVLQDENYRYIHVGIASHNLFEIAYAYLQIQAHGAQSSFTFEMLEGMSIQASLELKKLHQLILYAPACEEAHFNNAIAYLVRRLDENTSEDNFMRHFFNLKVNDQHWEIQKSRFIASVEKMHTFNPQAKRKQNRLLPPSRPDTQGFINEPDTDFILPANRKWAMKIKEKYEFYTQEDLFPMAEKKLDFKNKKEILNRRDQTLIASVYLASPTGIKEALKTAQSSKFSQKSLEEIAKILRKTAQIMRERRGDLIGIACLEVGKTFPEVDAEVSEAIDFLEFYPHSLERFREENPHLHFSPKGIGVVISPWNFPIAIPTGSIAAPLSAGNKIIFKPSSLSAISAYKICECFWDAGIPKDALIYLPARGEDLCKHLLKKKEIAFCILTGGEHTAYEILKSNPSLLLSAETGGKNATIVSKFADRDQAIKNVIHSAFSNSGQKCSATSLLILEEEVYEDELFKQTLKDAAQSLNVGDPFEFKNKMAYLADWPNEKIQMAINVLTEDEEWLLEPVFKAPYLLTPGIKYGTKVGDFTHHTELFSPILSVIKAKDLPHAIEIANATGYGLTGGLESLDEREWEYYLAHIQVGNVYINKPTTGAIVLRQPFGGMKKSAIGFGRKVGSFNYVIQFLQFTLEQTPHTPQYSPSKFINQLKRKIEQIPQYEELLARARDYEYHYLHHFTSPQEYIHIRGEHNLFVYKKIKNMLYRISDQDEAVDILSVIIASSIAKVALTLSFEGDFKLKDFIKTHFPHVQLQEQNQEELIRHIPSFERIRYSGKDSEIYMQCALQAKIIIREKPLRSGRVELLYYFDEQSQSISFHRYGNLGAEILKKGGEHARKP